MKELTYDLWGNVPALQINVSEATNIQIKGNHDLEYFAISIDAKKRYVIGSDKRRVSEAEITF